jgi:hypothetical protein
VKLVLCLTAVVVAGMLASCGAGSSSDGSGETASSARSKLTKAQFVAKANRLCSQFNETIGQFFKTPNALADVPDIYEGFFMRLQSLGGPGGHRLHALIGAGYEIDEAYETIESGVVHHDQNEIARGSSDVAEEKSTFAFAARGYGLTECSHGTGFTGGVGFPFHSLG